MYNKDKEVKNAFLIGLAVCMLLASFFLGVIFVYDTNHKMVSLNAGQYMWVLRVFVEKFSICSIIFVIGLTLLLIMVRKSHIENNQMKELLKTTKTLAQHQRLEAIGIMASNVNHEFSNLLTPIMGYSMLAMEKVPAENEELLEDLENIYEASTKAKELVTEFLKLSRKGGDEEYKCFSPDKMLDTVEELLKPSCPSNVVVEKDYHCPQECLCANETQISQVVMNIVINAFQVLEKTGGKVNISTKLVNDVVEIKVSDNGPGISEEELKHIREPFYTTKVDSGTGLGLAIVDQIVINHRGELIINSEVGKGSDFIIRIPTNTAGETKNK